MLPSRPVRLSLAAAVLLAACNAGPKKPDAPPPNPIKGQIDAAHNAANADSAAIKQSEDRMRAAATEAAGADGPQQSQ
ncbi:MAG: hypothetical protein JWM27_1747 [Gemmatimonadetes bacterium]|nr:hypothetical protein [Gemmatimonadota bacterium]